MSRPVFIHSLFRAGSTYLFEVFRRSGNAYWCYQEPLHEISLAARERPELLLEKGEDLAKVLRHPNLEQPYFFELHEVAGQCLGHIKKEHIYESYFASEEDDFGLEFWRALINAAKGTPVVQECRTSSRIGLLKKTLGGTHIYLWRNPWDQWWSLKVGDYFDAVLQLCISGSRHPEVVARLRQEIGFQPCSDDDLMGQLMWFIDHPLSPENSYLLFYILWMLALIESRQHADVLLNIDRLSDDEGYRGRMIAGLAECGVEGIAFADCVVPQAFYGAGDRKFFGAIEDRAHGLLLLSGMRQCELQELLSIRQDNTPKIGSASLGESSRVDLLRDAERVRSVAMRMERALHERAGRSDAHANVRDARILELEIETGHLSTALESAREECRHQEGQLQQTHHRLAAAVEEAGRHAAELESVRLQLQGATEGVGYWQQRAEESAAQIQAIMASSSWRLTVPLRIMKSVVIHVLKIPGSLKSRVRRKLVSSAQAVWANPNWRRRINGFLLRFPRFRVYLKRYVNHQSSGMQTSESVEAGQLVAGDFSVERTLGINANKMTPLERHFRTKN